ncbi:MAG: SUMF1/EgtB/PvdO family nonheme iron enzyme [Planctomycetia bacterium]|nr:SUMF1/EgtB/PvdO family nonheme iron enzyme [Planctomycetia bacterium]
MRYFTITTFLLFFSTIGNVLANEVMREWKSQSGEFLIEAAWDSEKDAAPETVFLKNGKRKFKIPFANLSQNDQKYIKEERRKKAERSSYGEYFENEEETDAISSEISFSSATKHAILVGVTDYETLNPLQYTVNDILAIKKRLTQLGFSESNIHTITSKSEAANIPLKRIVEKTIDEVLEMTKKGDVVFMAFAGHGFQIGSKSYFATQDTQTENLEKTALCLNQVYEKLEKSNAHFKWVVVDACRRSTFRERSPSGVRAIQKIDSPPQGIVLLQSCGDGEASYEDPNIKHGYFSYNFINALDGKADADDDGKLTFMEVCKYTTDLTVEDVRRKYHMSQRPYLTGKVTDFIIKEDIHRPKSNELYENAVKFREKGDYDAALKSIKEALKFHPRDEKYLMERKTIVQMQVMEKEKDRLALEKKRLEEEIASKPDPQLTPSVPTLQPGHQSILQTPPPSAQSTQLPQSAQPNELAQPLQLVQPHSVEPTQLAQPPQSPQPIPPVQPTPQMMLQPGMNPSLLKQPHDGTSQLQAGHGAGASMVKILDGIEYRFRWCPPGTFIMGSPYTESDRGRDELQHHVTFTKGFWILETEVTQAMWKSIMGRTQSEQNALTNYESDCGKGAQYPIYRVNWQECQDFCARLSESLSIQVTLPTEAQWEYACRAGTTEKYAGILDMMAWNSENSGSRTHPVATKRPNAWGIYDMHGNVWEWCSDWYSSTYYEESPTSDPTGPETGSHRVARGGSWILNMKNSRSAKRLNYAPDARFNALGLRIVIQIP